MRIKKGSVDTYVPVLDWRVGFLDHSFGWFILCHLSFNPSGYFGKSFLRCSFREFIFFSSFPVELWVEFFLPGCFLMSVQSFICNFQEDVDVEVDSMFVHEFFV